MRRFRHTSVVLALLLGLSVAATPVAQAAEPVSSVEAAQKKKTKKKKRKRVKCKARQVKERLKVGKRKRTRCVAAKRAWPAPKPVDMRTESTGYVLDANFSKVRDRRGRKAKSLHRGESGSFTARTNATPGGSPERATWTLVGSGNAGVGPDSASSNPATFSHSPPFDVASQTPVTAVVRSVSKAGVAQDTWKQPTEGDPLINRIAGSIGGRQNFHGSIFTWRGSATFVRASPALFPDGYFTLQSAQYTAIASGRDGSGATACQQSGTKTVTGGSGELDVRGEPPSHGPPFSYAGGLFGPLPESQVMRVTLHDCPPGAEDWEGQQVDASMAFAPFDTRGSRVSADGKAFAGSVTETSGQFTVTWDWDLTGSP